MYWSVLECTSALLDDDFNVSLSVFYMLNNHASCEGEFPEKEGG